MAADANTVFPLDPACFLCGSREGSLVLQSVQLDNQRKPHPFSLVRCGGCGLGHTRPQPMAGQLASFYPPDYAPHQKKAASERSGGGKLSLWWSDCPERKAIKPFGQGRLLDFGCGGGSYLQRMKTQGWQVTGVDSSRETCHRLRENENLEALEGTLPHPELKGRSFEVITLWQSLEHVADPLGVLRAARELLVPGGMLLVAVPALDSWNFERFRGDWYCVDMPRHLVHFTQPSLEKSIREGGFRVLTSTRILHTEWLRRSAVRRRESGGNWFDGFLSQRMGARLASLWIHGFLNRADCLYVRATVDR